MTHARQLPPPSRHPLRLGTAAAALALTLLAVTAAIAAAPASAAAPPRFVGLQGWKEPSATKFKQLDRARVNTWRQNLVWASVESERGRYTWGRYDKLFAKAARYNVRIFPVLIGSPRWARGRTQYPPATRNHRRAFYRFAKAAVRRYGPHGYFWRNSRRPKSVRPAFWQVWNEPNLPNYWNGRVDPQDYGRFLKNTSKAANDADPAVQIVAAGLPQTTCSAGPCIDDFLREMYKVPNIGRWIDGVAVHAYTGDYRGIFYRMDLARNQTIRSLGKSRKLFVTEFGWSTGGGHRYFTTSHSGQSSRLWWSYRKLIDNRERYRLKGAFWFGFKDPLGKGSSWQYHTGLFDQDWHAKPAWGSLLRITGGRP